MCSRVFLLFLGCLLAALDLSARPVKAQRATLELVAETREVVPGETLYLAVHFELDPHWHLYWRNAGASGSAPEFFWSLPEGLTAGEPEYPAPDRLDLGGLTSYIHEDAVTYIVPVEVAATVVPGQRLRIGVEVFYLVCETECLLGKASLALELTAAETTALGPDAGLFTTARANQPLADSPWTFTPILQEKRLRVEVRGAELPEALYFYAAEEGFVDPNAPQPYVVEDGVGVLELPLAFAYFDAADPVMPGVLQSPSASWQVAIPAAVGEGTSAAKPADAGYEASGAVGFEQRLLNLGLGGWLLLAFLGGLILNVMPCVLPVLSLKVFSLLKHCDQSRRQAIAHGLAYTLGVVLSFLVLAGVLFGLRAIGQSIGWGFQLQNPGFVLVLAVIFFVFGLNLLGVFEIGTGLVGADQKVAGRKDLGGSFGVGVLAAVVGAPCVGPLVGGVSGVALQTHTATGILIFAMMGLGMASPFLFLAAFPKLVAYLPKPGAWMLVFKQLMGFLLLASVIFLVYLMGQLAGLIAVTVLLVVLFFGALAAWIYGTWAAPHRRRGSKQMARIAAALLIGSSLGLGLGAVRSAFDGNLTTTETVAADEIWQPWSREAVDGALAEGRPVFVDFTATWCLICQVNKKTALRTESTAALFSKYNVRALSADWTRYDAAITEELERFGRSGVPLYLLYAPDGEVRVLPQNLTSRTIREAVEALL